MKFFAVLLAGVALGGVLTYLVIIKAPNRERPPAPRVVPPQGGPPTSTATIELDEQFFNTLLATIFRDVGSPSFPAEQPGGGCQNRVVIVSQGANGTRTGVTLRNGEVVAPLAFQGGFTLAPLPCIPIAGTAQAGITLYFKQEEQTLYGQINVRTVNLENASPEDSPAITSFVQTALNERVNPITIIKGAPLAVALPVQAAGGTVQATAREVNSEVRDGKLRLTITYDFSGTRGLPSAAPSP
jgi:hypothetical protein